MNKYVMILMLFAANSYAENWLGVGANGRGMITYIDIDSASRKGDLATIHWKSSNERGEMLFDCKKNESILHSIGFVDSPRPIKETSEAHQNAFEKACKRWYEIWR